LDADSDGDCIPDTIEKGPNGATPVDTDGDGTPDYLDLDSDNDGILDSYENSVCTPAVPLCDTDGDGIPNYLDLDSDNDGVMDVIEAGGTDANNDGEVDGPIGSNGIPVNANGGSTPNDTDADGNVDPYDVDDDGDGIDTIDEDVNVDGDPRNDDTDSDGIPNYLDIDSDGDGVTDAQELIDGTDPVDPCDFESTSVTLPQAASWNVADCDNDGLTNGEEIAIGTDPLNPDTDGDGVIDGTEVDDNTDPTNPCEANMANVTLPLSQAFLEGDCDGDGLSNGDEIGPNPNEPFDPNGNGIPDYLEPNNHMPSEDELEVFNLVTPNGDGDNDVFVIRNIELYPDNSVEIYNRWGVKVFGVRGYGQDQNYFRGVSEGRATINQDAELPVGTYWYIIKYKNAQGIWKQRVGYLYLNK
jgi:gliding motility-associated-like protein